MTNYSQDEDDRRNDRLTLAKRNSVSSVEIGKDETPPKAALFQGVVPYNAVDIEISDDDLIKVALQAHERDITINKMVGLIIKDGLQSTEHKFEHPPQLLNEG